MIYYEINVLKLQFHRRLCWEKAGSPETTRQRETQTARRRVCESECVCLASSTLTSELTHFHSERVVQKIRRHAKKYKTYKNLYV